MGISNVGLNFSSENAPINLIVLMLDIDGRCIFPFVYFAIERSLKAAMDSEISGDPDTPIVIDVSPSCIYVFNDKFLS